MRQITCSIPCLHIFFADLGSWTNIPLVSLDSLATVEATNLIFAEDGIETTIVSSVEFGHLMTKLVEVTEMDSIHCWISFPDHIVTSELALYRNMMESGKPEVAFDGSPLTLVLVKLLESYLQDHLYESGDFDPVVCAWICFRHAKVCRAEYVLPFGDRNMRSSHIFNIELQDMLGVLVPLMRNLSLPAKQLETRVANPV